MTKQESIPVGCVPSAALAVGGGGVCPGGEVSAWGVSAWGCLPRGVSQHALRQTPPVDRILDTRL